MNNDLRVVTTRPLTLLVDVDIELTYAMGADTTTRDWPLSIEMRICWLSPAVEDTDMYESLNTVKKTVHVPQQSTLNPALFDWGRLVLTKLVHSLEVFCHVETFCSSRLKHHSKQQVHRLK